MSLHLGFCQEQATPFENDLDEFVSRKESLYKRKKGEEMKCANLILTSLMR